MAKHQHSINKKAHGPYTMVSLLIVDSKFILIKGQIFMLE